MQTFQSNVPYINQQAPLTPLDEVAKRLGIQAKKQSLDIGQQQLQEGSQKLAAGQLSAQTAAQLRQILQDPTNHDPQTGMVNDQGRAKLYTVDPSTAAALDKALGKDPLSAANIADIQSQAADRNAQAAARPLIAQTDLQKAQTADLNAKDAIAARLEAARNKPIDPNSAEGIAAAIAKSQGEYHAPPPQRNIDPNSPEGIAAQLKLKTAESGIANTEDINALADSVFQNPDLLKGLNPTLQGKVLTSIAKSGRSLPNAKLDTQDRMAEDALNTIKYLKDNLNITGGGSGAVGAKGPTSLFGILKEPVAGSQAANYLDYINTLKSQITLPNLDILRGLGRVTDREFKALHDSMTALNPNMSEAQFGKELDKIEGALTSIRSRKDQPQQAPLKPKTDPLGIR